MTDNDSVCLPLFLPLDFPEITGIPGRAKSIQDNECENFGHTTS